MLATVERLTAREAQMLDALAEGLENHEIGAEWFISVGTVEKHVRSLREKLGARNRAHAVALAYHHGLLVPKQS